MSELEDPFDKAKTLLDNVLEIKKKEELDRNVPIILEIIKSKGDNGLFQNEMWKEFVYKGIRPMEVARALIYLKEKGVITKKRIEVMRNRRPIVGVTKWEITSKVK